jgi:Leucine-rich repeat (LRR) protein
MKYIVEICLVSLTLLLSPDLFSQPGKVYESLAEAMSQPDQVYSLRLRKSKLKQLPEELRSFKNLVWLDLGKNKLSELPEWIADLPLQELYLSRNRLTAIPPVVFKLTNLRVLALDQNKISVIPPEIGELVNLEVLDLWDSEIESLPPEMKELVNLKKLDIRNTLIYEREAKPYKDWLPNTEILVSFGCNCRK